VLRIDVNPADILPYVSLSTPVNHNTYTGTSLTISGTSSDSDGSVSKIELYASGVLLTTITSGTGSFSYTWTNVPKGAYTISARAIDNKKGLGISTAYIKISPNTCTAPQWNSATAYVGGNEVVYGGIRYHANWWNQNERPDTHNGGAGSGMPWPSLGACNTRMDVSINNNAMDLYPNPASEVTNVSFDNSVSGSVQIIISDMLSNAVLTKETSAEAGNNIINLDVTSLKPGVYVVSVTNGTDRLVKQLVIK